MGKAQNIRFIEEYIATDEALGRHPLNKKGGIGGYIEALEAKKLNTGGTKTLVFLKRCKDVRNRLTHSPGAIRDLDKLTRSDIRRLRVLRRDLLRGKDPLSKKPSDARRGAILTAIVSIVALLIMAIFANK